MSMDQAVSVIERWREQPFFLLVSHYAVLHPFVGPQDLVAKHMRNNAAGLKRQDPLYAAMVDDIDLSVNRIRDGLIRAGIADRTIIVFTSDNGGLTYWPRPTSSAQLRGGESSLSEGAVRVPAIILGPSLTPKDTTSDQPVITPCCNLNILAMTGTRGDEAHNRNLAVASPAPLLREPAQAPGRRAIYWPYPQYHVGA